MSNHILKIEQFKNAISTAALARSVLPFTLLLGLSLSLLGRLSRP